MVRELGGCLSGAGRPGSASICLSSFLPDSFSAQPACLGSHGQESSACVQARQCSATGGCVRRGAMSSHGSVALAGPVGWWWWGGGNVLAFFLLEKRVRSSQSDQSTNRYDRNNEGKL